MIFLGGEVVVDYANRLRKELAGRGDSLWVTSYANDVYGYLASERVLGEGGYEFDYWAYLYNQPGPWSAGTEEIVIRRVLDVVNNPIGEGNLDPEASLRSIRVADGLEVELVACEPAIADPVNIAFGPDGKLWVAEMGDYPLGEDNAGGAGGRVRYLQDRDGDGRFETSTLFLDGLHFATGVHPWRDGVIVSAPPEVFYVPVDTKTGKAGPKEAILDGFAKGNPQHVVNGFCVGLDNWIYINGDETGVIRSVKKGYSLNMSGRDARFLPASGEFQIECGMTQHLRSRNDAGDWFGGANYCPFWHYVLEEQYLKRNPYVVTPRPWHDVYGGFYPQVFPAGRIVDRFNDLFTAGRFTSACSPMPYRDELLGEGSHETIFACEPVHNLVHRARLVPDGLSFRAERFSADAESEFFASRDPWSRPVRVVTGPDGAVWIVDMYRQVIEHPTWIPEAWLARLDVRAGSDKGRIYRVYPKGKRPATAIPQLAGRSTRELVTLLGSSNGWTRDTAQQLLVEVQRADATEDLQKVVRSHDKPMARLHALGTLDGLGELKPDLLLTALDDPNPAVRRFAVRLSDRDLDGQLRLAARVGLAAEDPDARVRFQAAFVLGGWKDEIAADALGRIAVKDGTDPWFRVAILSSAIHHPERVLRAALAGDDSQDRSALIDGLLATSVGFQGDAGIGKIVEQILPLREKSAESWQFQALGSLMDALDRRGMRLEGWIEKADPGLADRLIALESAARRAALDDSEEMDRRTSAVGVLGRASAEREQDRQRLESLLLPTIPLEVQRAAVRVLGKLKDGEIPGLLLAGWASHSPTVRTDVLSVLMSRPEWITPLLDAIESGRVRSSELSAATQQELTNHPTSAVAERSQKLLQTGESDRREVFDRYQSVLSMTGDAGRGRDLFSRHCSACHRFGGVGQLVGPDLGGVRDRSPAGILTAVLDPNRAVESKYTGYTVVMLDGRVLSGMLLVEGSSSITLARPDGKADKLLRVDIDTMTGTGKSFMPEGLEKDVSPEALADIIAFLAQSPEDVSGK
jgi:putative membrane-bound dehydrogenase-like protein